MLAAPLLGERARAKILEYIVAKKAGHYGSSKSGLRKFDQRLAAHNFRLEEIMGISNDKRLDFRQSREVTLDLITGCDGGVAHRMANDAMRKIHSPLIFFALMMGHGWPSTK
jgi:hypothetical protein